MRGLASKDVCFPPYIPWGGEGGGGKEEEGERRGGCVCADDVESFGCHVLGAEKVYLKNRELQLFVFGKPEKKPGKIREFCQDPGVGTLSLEQS